MTTQARQQLTPDTCAGPSAWAGLAIALVVAFVGAAIGWSSAGHIETLWDEHVDRAIAIGLRDQPLTGETPAIDASQTRLPMYVNAAVFALTGRTDLPVSRATSLVFGALTVIGAYLLGRSLFGPLVGALAALLLAFSPYFLSFARISMTEGDVFFACFATLAVWGFTRYLSRPTAGRWLAAAMLFGLAAGAKVFAVVLIVALVASAGLFGQLRPTSASSDRRRAFAVLTLLIAGAAVILAGLVAASFSQLAALFLWAVLAGLWCYAVVFVLKTKAAPAGPAASIIGMVLLAAITFCVLMPAHLTSREIARTIVRRLVGWDRQVPLAHLADHLRLYSGILLLKLTVPLGVITVASLVYGLARLRRDAAWRVCVLPTVVYVAALCFLPLRQTFYLMGVYPLLMILTAAFIVGIGRWLGRRRAWAGGAWGVVVVALIVHLGVNVYRAYPCFHLYGYELIGNRWLGAESRGYRNLIQTPSDGVESLIRWCNADSRVRPGSRVVSFLWEDLPGQMVDDLLPPNPPYVFIRRGLTDKSSFLPPAPSIKDADFVLLHINNFLGYGDQPPDLPPLAELQAAFTPIYTVRRGPLEVAWVYARRD